VIVGGTCWIISVQNKEMQAQAMQYEAYLRPFLPHMGEYTATPRGTEIQAAYRHKKVMPIRVNNNRGIDSLIMSLPPQLRPGSPEEVGTILWLEWRNEVVGRYTDGIDAIQITCTVTLIDKSKSLIIAHNEFKGGEPPQQRKSGQPNVGSEPIGPIVHWLTTLPER
jgi:hypothetical protein